MRIRECIKDLIPYSPGKLKKGAIKLASNENPLGIAPKALNAISNGANQSSLYPDGACVELKSALASKYNLSSDNFVIGNGSDEVLVLITGAYIEPGDNAITSSLTFSEYAFATRLFGGEMRFAKTENGRFQLDTIASMIDNRTKIIFLCNPNNPTGTYFTDSELNEFVNKIPRDILLVIDEAYREYMTAADVPESLKLINTRGNVIILRTFSKIYGLAGLRIGYGIADKSLISDLNKTRAPFNVNSLAQLAAVAALEDNDFLKKSFLVNEEGKRYLYAAFERLNLEYYPTQANFIYVKVNQDCTNVFERLMSMGVTVRPMKSFGVNDCIRVTIGTADQNIFFIDCLEKIVNEKDGLENSSKVKILNS